MGPAVSLEGGEVALDGKGDDVVKLDGKGDDYIAKDNAYRELLAESLREVDVNAAHAVVGRAVVDPAY